MTTTQEVREYCQQVLSGLVLDGATLYALLVTQRKIVAGPWVRKSCEKHLKDLASDTLIWDVEAGQKAITFFEEMLVFTDGAKVGQPFILELWQQFIVGSLFGWKGADGWRRFRTAYIEIGKGNGKSPLAGGIGIYMLAADQEAAAEVYAAATKLDQAKILWNDAKRMVETSPILSNFLTVRSNSIVLAENNSVFRPISSEKRGLDGPRVHAGLVDELHEHADATVVNKLRAGTKARNQALIFEITNSGFDKKTICYQHHEFSIRLLQGIETNDTWFSFICGLDEGDDWENDESCWVKANPNLGVSIQLKYLREQVNEARGMPANRSIVARLNFCQWVGAENPWIGEDRWNGRIVATDAVSWEALRKYPCYLGIDLSSRKDLTAVAVVWKLPEGLVCKVFYFTPLEGLEQRAKADKTQYDVWVKEGWITATPGSMVDYAFVAVQIKGIVEANDDVQGAAFDPWRIDQLKKELTEWSVDVNLVRHGQGFGGGDSKTTLWMPKSIEKFEEHIFAETIWIENNPVTTMCAANVVVATDPVGNKKFEKRKATGRIDGIVALAQAIGYAEYNDGPIGSKYEEHDLFLL